MVGNGGFGLNNWSFSQLCSLAGVSKDTVNKLSSPTAHRVLEETLPKESKPLQFLTTGHNGGSLIRSIHGAGYTRSEKGIAPSNLREEDVNELSH